MAKSSGSGPIKYADKSAGQPELNSLFQSLKKILSGFARGNFAVKENRPGCYSIYYGKEIELLGRKYPELCFVSLLVQKGYVGFYFFPIYVEGSIKEKIAPALLKHLKGKTCFHIKRDDTDLINHIKEALRTGYDFYVSRGWK